MNKLFDQIGRCTAVKHLIICIDYYLYCNVNFTIYHPCTRTARGHPVGVTGGGAHVHQERQVSPGGAPQLIFKVNVTTNDNLENLIGY